MKGLVVDQWAEDMKRLRLPMPAFGGVNAFILGSPGGQTIVDTGMPGAETGAIWQSAQRDGLLGNVEAVLCTHAHIDHVGQAGRLARETGAPLLMSAGEHEDIVRLSQMSLEEREQLADTFQDKGGFPVEGRGQPTDYSVLAPFPEQVQILKEGDQVNLGSIEFEVLLGGGHSRAPVCLLSRERKLLLAGDQLLMGSGPQVPVQAERPEDDMLGAYFCFLDRLDTLPSGLVVFPGHGEPIHDFKQQVARIRDGHRLRLERLLEAMSGPMTCAEMAPLVFSNPSNRLAARVPYLMRAMTNHLVARLQLQVCYDAGVLRYQKESC